MNSTIIGAGSADSLFNSGAESGAESGPHGSPAPKVWLLFGKYHGDNSQVQGLGEALAVQGWQIEIKTIKFKPLNGERRHIPASIDFARCSDLSEPWPDAVIACGRFYGAVAHWLKRQSGGRIVHVQLGRFGSPLPDIDVMAVTAQYGVPMAPNVVPLALPIVLHRPERSAETAAIWLPRLAHLPRPWTAILVGGEASQIPFGPAEADIAVNQATATGRKYGGALLLAFSPRSRQPIKERIEAGLAGSDLPHIVFDWPPPQPNPYPALLALADRFLVSGDSASMIADACIAGRPLELIHLPIRKYVTRFSSRGLKVSLDARRRARARAGKPADAFDRLRDMLVLRRWLRPWDDVRDYLHRLEQVGLLTSPEGEETDSTGRDIQGSEIALVTERINRLVRSRRSALGPA